MCRFRCWSWVGLAVGAAVDWAVSVEVLGWIVEMFGLGLTLYYARLGKSRMQGM
jgi:hypothetical protein